MPDCFIVMPITTYEPEKYSNDQDHFKHVLDFLFIPAIEKAGFNAIPPSAEGGDIIHGEIIKNIQHADLVLCDMSSLNANVFFELGIRTAVNKSVCLVKDDATPKVPFDISIINHHTYISALNPWTLEKQIEALSNHIIKSAQKSDGKNSMWNYFSLSSDAKALSDSNRKAREIERDHQKFANKNHSTSNIEFNQINEINRLIKNPEKLFDNLVEIASSNGVTVTSAIWDDDDIEISVLSEFPPYNIRQMMERTAIGYGYRLSITLEEHELDEVITKNPD